MIYYYLLINLSKLYNLLLFIKLSDKYKINKIKYFSQK